MSVNYPLLILILITALNISGQTIRTNQQPDRSYREIILQQYKIYPRMELQDLYKFIYQAAFGVIHINMDSAAVERWLRNEWQQTEADSQQPALEIIRPDFKLCRVNIASFKAKGGSIDLLLNAFLTTARNFKTDEQIFRNYIKAITFMAEKKLIPVKKAEFKSFIRKMELAGLPAVHHTDTYKKLYHPAYRIVLRELIEF